MQGSTCVEAMTTFHGSVLSLRRHVRGCILLEGTIASIRDPLKSTPIPFGVILNLQVEPQIFLLGFLPHTWVYLKAFGATLVIAWIQYFLFWPLTKLAQRLVRVCVSVWTTLCCVVLDSSFCSLSLTCFLLRALVSLPFLTQYISFSLLLYFLLYTLGYVHRS